MDDSGEPLLDKDFFYLLRDLKALGEKEKEHRWPSRIIVFKDFIFPQTGDLPAGTRCARRWAGLGSPRGPCPR